MQWRKNMIDFNNVEISEWEPVFDEAIDEET